MTYDGLWKTEIGKCLMLLEHINVTKDLYTRMKCKVISGKWNGTGLLSVLPTRNITLSVMDTSHNMRIIYVRQRGGGERSES